MRLEIVRESGKARTLALRVLADRRAVDLASLPDEALASWQVGAVPVYGISVDDLLGGNLAAAWRSGWRYLWAQPEADEGLVVTIVQPPGRRPRFTSFASGRMTGEILRAFAAAEAAADEALSYRVRLLRLPLIHREAIWLAPRDEKAEHVMAFIGGGGIVSLGEVQAAVRRQRDSQTSRAAPIKPPRRPASRRRPS